jgi:hypothetical protein
MPLPALELLAVAVLQSVQAVLQAAVRVLLAALIWMCGKPYLKRVLQQNWGLHQH